MKFKYIIIRENYSISGTNDDTLAKEYAEQDFIVYDMNTGKVINPLLDIDIESVDDKPEGIE